MTNKYRGIQPTPPAAEAGQDPDTVEGTFGGGIVLFESAQDIPLDTSPDHDKVRVERGALRADYGYEAIGDPAASRVLAMGEHRFVDAFGDVFEKIFRLYIDATFAKIQTLEAGVWTDAVTGDFVISDVLHDWRSHFDKLFFADGAQVYVWDQSSLNDDEGNDWASALIMKGPVPGGTQTISITPAGAQDNTYTVHYSVVIEGPTLLEGSFAVAVNHIDVEVGRKVHTVPASTDPARTLTLPHQKIEFTEEITPGDALSLIIASLGGTLPFTGTPVTMVGDYIVPVDAPDIAASLDWIFDKGSTRMTWLADASNPGVYRSRFTLEDNGAGGTADVEVWFRVAGVWTLEETILAVADQVFTSHNTPEGGFDRQIERVGLKLSAAAIAAGWTWYVTPDYEWKDLFEFKIHGFNEATDADPTKGVTYSTLGAAANDLEQVLDEEGNLIVGRFLGTQADRLLVLQAGEDPQRIRAHANDDPDTWSGDGTIDAILESRSDPIDELMAHAMLTSNVGVLFRRRSLMRVISTGQLEPPLAFIPWIENLGTESPFSIRVVPGGILFLGSDREVYFLTEQGLTAVGPPITEGFNLDETNVSSVEGLYDPITQEYTLSLPLSAP